VTGSSVLLYGTGVVQKSVAQQCVLCGLSFAVIGDIWCVGAFLGLWEGAGHVWIRLKS
jgi:hypothetical protein